MRMSAAAGMRHTKGAARSSGVMKDIRETRHHHSSEHVTQKAFEA